MDAVILAGGAVPAALREHVETDERALVPVGGVPMLSRVVAGVREVSEVERILCVSTLGAREILPPEVEWLQAGDKLTENLFAGVRAARSDAILVVTGDGPLSDGATWREFLNGAKAREAEFGYPIVRREVMEAAFSVGRRTYAPLRDGSFTGGNGFLLPRARLPQFQELIERSFAARKNPFALARILGPMFIARAFARKLSVADIENRTSQLLGGRVAAVEMQDARVAFDVDKPEDLIGAEAILNAASAR